MASAPSASRPDDSLVSIIVPVYGTEAVLPELLDSFLAQTRSRWEAVLVIDGSPDDAVGVARAYAGRDPRFVVVEVDNGGIGRARNIGLDRARGDVIVFCDSDDVLAADALEVLTDALDASGAEIATAIGIDFFGTRRRGARYWTMHGEQFERGWATYEVTQEPALLEDHVVWAKAFRRGLVDRIGLRFPEGVQCEDILPMLRLQLAAGTIAVAPVVVYRHRRHERTVSADYLRPRTLGDWLEQSLATIEEIVAHGDPALIEHYVGSHVLGQWWTRAELVPLVEDAALVTGIEAIAARIVEVLDDRLDALDPLRAPAVRAFADGGASRSWSGLAAALQHLGPSERRAWDASTTDVVVSPLVAPSPASAAMVATAAVQAAEMLDPAREAEAALAAALLVAQVLAPVAHGRVADEARALALVERAEDGLARLPRAALEGVALPSAPLVHASTAAADAARAAIDRVPVRSARLLGMRLERGALLLRGTLRLPRPLDERDELVAVVRSTDGEHHRESAVAAHRTLSGEVAWSTRIDVPAPATGRELAVTIRRARRGRRPAELPVVAASLPTALEEQGADGLRAVALRAAPLLLRAERRDGAPLPAPRPRPAAPERVYAFPDWLSNPYVTMLQTSSRARGRAFAGSERFEDLVHELEHGRGTLHLQWTSPVTERARDADDAERRVDAVLDGLRRARAAGRAIVWTVHNVLPHDTRFPAAAIRLHQGLADVAHVVHALGTTTQRAIGDLYRLPEDRVRVLPHSSYAGIYGARVPQHEARALLGAPADGRQALFFGQMRPYKGLEHLFGAAASLAGGATPVSLLLAGNPTPEVRAEIESLEGVPRTAALRFVEDDEVAAWCSAADVAVLPYRNILNSGTMHLAATYGLPVVLPDEPVLTADLRDEPWIGWFDVEHPQESIAALLADDWYLDPDVRESAREFARRRSPFAMAEGFEALLVEAEALARR